MRYSVDQSRFLRTKLKQNFGDLPFGNPKTKLFKNLVVINTYINKNNINYKDGLILTVRSVYKIFVL